MSRSDTPVLGFVARHSNSGKTTLLEHLIPILARGGVATSVIKHVHHRIDLDSPGKDSYRFREAGARQVLVASERRWALLTESPACEPDLNHLIGNLDHSEIQLVLVEGLRDERYPKIEVSLDNEAATPLCLNDPDIIALASRHRFDGLNVPWFSIDDHDAIGRFIFDWLESREISTSTDSH